MGPVEVILAQTALDVLGRRIGVHDVFEVYAADQLFATLDPTLRRLTLPGFGPVVLADTVGFVSDLPHELIAAFRATLQETREADMILHVVDCVDEDRQQKIEAVNQVLAEVGADEVPRLLIYNKIDLAEYAPRIDRDEQGKALRVWLSAKTGDGFDEWRQVVAEYFAVRTHRCELKLAAHEGQNILD